jgi:signal peptide peptidase SppA
MHNPKYRHIAQAVYGRPWAIVPDTLALIVDILEFRAAGGILTEEEIDERIQGAANGPRKGGRQAGSVAVIPVYGPISQRQNLMSANSGGTSVEGLTADFRAALADPGVDAIVLEVDSPGGTVDGIPELADEIYAARGQKPILAHANTMAASAAYWLASAAQEIQVTRSGSVGSVGVFMAHQDMSKAAELEGVKTTLISHGKYKTEGNRWEPLSDEARANLQDQVDQIGQMFTSTLAKNRATPVETVRSSYGQGRLVLAKQALAAGMVDGIATLDDTIRRASRLALAGQNPDKLGALDPALPFNTRLALVSAATTDLLEHATARLDMRAKDGRSIPTADRAGLLALADSLRAVAEAQVDELEEEPAAAAAADQAWARAAQNRIALARAEHDF